MYVTREDTRPPPQNTTNHKPQTTNHHNRTIDGSIATVFIVFVCIKIPINTVNQNITQV